MDVPLLRDIVFRKVFAEETSSEPTLRALLNAILGLEGSDRIAALEINDPHLLENFDDKTSILDVKATDNRGYRYNVEVQLLYHPNFPERCLHYLTRLFNENFSKGQAYSEIKRTVAIALLDYPFEKELMHNIYRMRSLFSGEDFSDHLEIHTVDLSKFKKDLPANLQTPLERWLHCLKYSLMYQDIGKELPLELSNEEGIAQAMATYQRVSASREVRSMLERQERAEHDRASYLQAALAEVKAETEAEKARADAEKARADEEKARAERYARKLRELGIEP
jgi:predicted transposase/invertase (TIGR01784 family)